MGTASLFSHKYVLHQFSITYMYIMYMYMCTSKNLWFNFFLNHHQCTCTKCRYWYVAWKMCSNYTYMYQIKLTLLLLIVIKYMYTYVAYHVTITARLTGQLWRPGQEGRRECLVQGQGPSPGWEKQRRPPATPAVQYAWWCQRDVWYDLGVWCAMCRVCVGVVYVWV